ncbi:MAG: amino acid ABC transporter permease [Candidatus Promineifilaceae bacterium]|nr:amino acid ABC transporter permease [Candidatus Promineifilaceae bacterium]
MATLQQSIRAVVRGARADSEYRFNPRYFIQDQLLRSWWFTALLIVLAYITASYTISRLGDDPATTIAILVVWAATLGWTVLSEVLRRHTVVTRWLKKNLYTSIANTLLTLLISLLLADVIAGFISWAFLRASFTTNPELASTILDGFANPGANWGAVFDNISLLMVFRYPQAEFWRLFAILGMLFVLAIPSAVLYPREEYRKHPARRVLTFLWLLTPFVTFFLLRGFRGNDALPYVNPGDLWGGLLLTLVIAVFGIVASFPLGLLLALGRRSDIRGVPAWLTWLLAGAITIWGLAISTPENLEAARTPFEQLYSYWPLLVPLFAYFFQRYFQGNVVALFSTIYIETVRGVPLITVLFMSVIIFPIFLPPGVEIISTWRVLAAVALFAAAYLAENVRGGLQSIPKGQYEAADALGLSTFKKYRLIILPQALRAVIPAIVGQFIGLFKDTTLVAIVGLVDLLGAANFISAQPDWLGVRRTPYVFIAIIYFIGSAIMAGYSRRLERRLGVGER